MTITLSRVAGAPLAQTLSIRNHRFTVDGSAAEGGSDAGPSPHDLYDAALGACKALTVLWYARRKGWAVQDVHTTVDRDDTQERQIGRAHV